MITLQSTLRYASDEEPPGSSIPLVFQNPLLRSTLVNATTLEATLDQSQLSETNAYLDLGSAKYAVNIPIGNVFGSPVITNMGSWLRWLLSRDAGDPNIEDLSITFQVKYRNEKDAAANLPALWFYSETPDHAVETRQADARPSITIPRMPPISVLSPPVISSPETTPPVLVPRPNQPLPSVSSVLTLEPFARSASPPTDATIEQKTYVVNKTVYMNMVDHLWPNLEPKRRSILLFIVNLLVDLTGGSPKLKSDLVSAQDDVLSLLERKGFQRDNAVYSYVITNFPTLFDFALELPAVPRLTVAGNVHVNKLADGSIPKVNFDLYHLTIEYQTGSEIPRPQNIQHYWDATTQRLQDRVVFSFAEDVYRFLVRGQVVVRLKSFTGSEAYRGRFLATDPALRNLDLLVPAAGPTVINSSASGMLNSGGKKLRGTVVSLNKSCTLKGAVVIEAKTTDDGQETVVSAGQSDKDGNFTMPYPYGKFVAARAVSSLGTSSYTTLKVVPTSAPEAISSDFIYILLQGQSDGAATSKDDCNCNPKSFADRLPSQDDLLQSNQFTQDIGAGCTNLSTPNRTLREFEYTAVVRHTDPDVANYILAADTTLATGPDDVDTTRYFLRRQGKVDRQLVDIDNPIQWQDLDDVVDGELEVYQAVTVSVGHVLHYKSEFKADGYSLGDLVYSLPLAPGQKKQIVTLDASHSLLGTETQSLTATEALANSLISERNIIDQIAGNIGEDLSGSSSASTAGVSAGLGAAGSMGAFGASLGVAGGYSNSSSKASQSSSRDISQFFSERLRQSLQQNASSHRQQNATVVTAVKEGQQYSAMTETIANHNHCHSLTMMYFEVLRHFAIFQDLVSVEECVFVPLLMAKFSLENLSRWADYLAPRLLQMPSKTYMKPSNFTYGQPNHPLLSAFDAAERVRTNWKMVDYPEHRYCDEAMDRVWGDFDLVVSIPRPITRYDNMLSLPVATKTVTTREYDPKQVMKDSILSALSFGLGGGDGKVDVTKVLDTRAKIFDGFMRLDENYETVPPARCVRIKSFNNITPVPDPSAISVNLDPISDFFSNDGGELDMWLAYSDILGHGHTMDGLKGMMSKYFTMQLIGDWDTVWYRNVAPNIYSKILQLVECSLTGFDLSDLSTYHGPGEQLVRASFDTSVTTPRVDVTKVTFSTNSTSAKALSKTLMKLRFQSVRIYYSTAHYNGQMFGGALTGDILDDAGASVPTLPTEAEKRNPRKDDRFLAQRLITHLNRNLEYYNRVLWTTMDSQRRYLLLDGFKIETFDKYGAHEDFRSLSSVLKNQLIGIVGNSLVFPVAPGYHVGQAFVVAQDAGEQELVSESLLDHYRPDEPAPPFRLSIPTRGIYSEAVMGQCDSCEKEKPDSSQDWTRFTTDEPTAINPLTAPVPTVTDYTPQIKDFAQPMVQIQNAPAAPDPGIGLKALTDLMGKSDIFKDITGLDANQKNAMQTYLSNQDNVKSMAQAASALSNMVNQAHNTANSNKIMDTVTSGHSSGALTDAERNKLVKDHVGQMIDGGKTKNAELADQKAKTRQPISSTVAQAAIDKNRDLTATVQEPDGTVSLSGGSGKSTMTMAEVAGLIPPIKQPDDNTCWAAVTAMMVSWKWQVSVEIPKAVQMAGDDYVDKFKAGAALDGPAGNKLVENLGLSSEGGGSYPWTHYVDLINKHGPIWVTVDADSSKGWSPHAIVVIKVEGYDGAPEEEVFVTVIDPSIGDTKRTTYAEHRKAFTETLTDAGPRSSGVSQIIGTQIMFWPFDITGAVGYNIGHTRGGVKSGIKPPVHENLTLWAMRTSTQMQLDPSITPGSDKPTNEFLRGVFWNDDPASLLFNLKENDNYVEAIGGLWALYYKLGSVAPPLPFNIIGRSHYGDMQWLHAMGSKMGEAPADTFNKILLWAEIMYKVSIGEGFGLDETTRNERVGISRNGVSLLNFFNRWTWPTSSQTISDLIAPLEVYTGLNVKRRCLGSILHMVQDSFAKGHTRRKLLNAEDAVDPAADPLVFKSGTYAKLGEITNYHTYTTTGEQEDHHADYDAYDTTKVKTLEDWNGLWGGRDAIAQSVMIVDFWKMGTKWEDGVSAWAEKCFKYADDATPSDDTVL